jgi:hypothetical protein
MKRLVLALAALAVLLWCAPAGAGDMIELTQPSLYCRSLSDYKRVMIFIAQDDKDAAAKMIVSGRCAVLQKGQQLYLMGKGTDGIIPVRLKGDIHSGYTELLGFK